MQLFRAGHVGRLIEPPALAAAREATRAGRMPPDEFAEYRRESIAETIRMQQDIGLRTITDGGFEHEPSRREFLRAIDGIDTGQKHPLEQPCIRDPIARTSPILIDKFQILHACTTETAKITLPSPAALHLAGGREAIDRRAYPDLDELWPHLAAIWRAEITDLAAAGCRYIQIDDTTITSLCDPACQSRLAARGDDWKSLARTYLRLLADVAPDHRDDLSLALYLARDNAAGEADFTPLAAALFNETAFNTYILDCEHRTPNAFAQLRDLPRGKLAMLGLVSARDPRLESRDLLKRTIDEAARYLPLEQLALAPTADFEPAGALTIDDQKRKLDLVVTTALDIWGTN